jgi:site-specific recombinase XerD
MSFGCCGKHAHAAMLRCPGARAWSFLTRNGTPLEARNVRRDFRKVIDAAGLTGREWTPRELRQSFVSLLSDANVPVGVIARLVGHRSTLLPKPSTVSSSGR